MATKKITRENISTESLAQLAKQYPWRGAAKVALEARGESVAQSIVYALRLRERNTPATQLLKAIDSSELQRSQMLGIIDDFLREGEHRIVIDEERTDEIEPTEEVDDALEEEFVSEELAEIYAKQHLFDLAIEIYQKLSLQNSQKSVYFAELIDKLRKESLEYERYRIGLAGPHRCRLRRENRLHRQQPQPDLFRI